MTTFKKLIHYARTHCGPRLSAEAADKLKSRYVLMRSGAHEQEKASDKRLSIPITVRQLEAIIRISESLAKMQLQPFATEVHVNEALRLFQVSTLDAAMSGSLAGAEGFTTDEDHEMLNRIERQLKRRFAIGSQVSEQNIIAVSHIISFQMPKSSINCSFYFVGFHASTILGTSRAESNLHNDSSRRTTAPNAEKDALSSSIILFRSILLLYFFIRCIFRGFK